MSALRAWRIAKKGKNQLTVTTSGSALSLTAVSRCLMNIVALKALSKPVIQSNYANKVVKPLETANRLAVRHVN